MHTENINYYNPYKKSWEIIEASIDKKLNYDYTNCKWIAIDGEFTGLYPQRDKSTLWTLCSEDENQNIRIEMLYTFNDDADITKLNDLMQSDIEKIFFYGKLDLAYLYKITGNKVKGPIYDVKLASIVTRTHTQMHSLKPLVQTYINPTEQIIDKGVLDHGDWVTDYTQWSQLLYQYNANDVLYLKFLSEKLKEISRLSKREHLVNSVNNALPELSVLYANGFYRDIFKHGYDDSDMQG